MNKFGSRWVAAVGAVFSCIAFCLSTLSTSINMMLLFYGCLGGWLVGWGVRVLVGLGEDVFFMFLNVFYVKVIDIF